MKSSLKKYEEQVRKFVLGMPSPTSELREGTRESLKFPSIPIFLCLWNCCHHMCCRKLYWTDQGTDSGVPAKVASANMDGSAIKTLFTGNLDHVEFITIDIKEQKLYWGVTSTGVV